VGKYSWKSAGRGIRYYKHETRKHGIRKDRYFYIRHSVDGKQIEEGLGWASQGWTATKARGLLSILNENKRRGEGPRTLKEKRELENIKRRKEQEKISREKKQKITFKEIFEGLYADTVKGDRHPSAWRSETSLFKGHLAPVIGDKPLKDIAPIHLERIKLTMKKKGRAPRTIQYALAVVRQVFNFAIRHNLYDGTNPVSKVRLPSSDNRRMRFLTYEEADALLTKLKGMSTAVYHMALLSLHTGMRAGEIFNLEWRDVDIDRGILTLRDTKNGKTRPAFMTNTVKTMFESMQEGKPSDLVFPSKKMSLRNEVSKTFLRSVNALGLNKGIKDRRYKVCFHTLRHTFASWHIEEGTDPYVVKELLGHSSFKMTERYVHLGENTLKAAVNRMNNIYKKMNSTPDKIHKKN